MYKKVLGVFLFISSALVAQNSTYTVNGSIEDNKYDGQKIYLQQLNEKRNGFISIDSTTIENSKFVFSKTNESNEPALRFISTPDPKNYNPAIFLTETGTLNITIAKQNVIEGTPLNNRFQEFSEAQESFNKELEMIVAKYSSMNQTSENQEKMMEEGQPIIESLKQMRYDFAKENINNDLGEFIALSSFEVFTPIQVLELTSLMRPQFRNSDIGQQVISYYEAQSVKSVGATYKDITLTDPRGNAISISDYVGKNKVILIDFWASWCGPCIKEMPNVVEAYKQYKDKGFEIIGISMDEDRGRWMSAIDRLGMTWPHMSDLKGWNSEAAKLYGIESIPYTLLLDQDGKIIDSNLRGNQLLNKLKELLD